MSFSPEEMNHLRLEPGDLLVCEGGEVGRCAVWRGELDECYCQNHIHRLRRKIDNIDPDFVALWLQAAFLHFGTFAGRSNKTTIPNLSGSRLKNFTVPKPPPDVQRQVVAALRTISEAISAQHRVAGALTVVFDTTLRKLFSPAATNLEIAMETTES